MSDLVDIAVDLTRDRLGKRWGRVPDFVQPLCLTPDARSLCLEPMHGSDAMDRIADALRLAHEYVAQQNAIDSPFAEMEREKAGRAGVCRVSRAAEPPAMPDALGLVINATKGTSVSEVAHRPIRECLKINRDAQRCKRMRTAVGHAARLLHFDAHTEREAQRWNKKFVTLTYRDADGWEAGHFGGFRRAMAEWCRRKKIRMRFVWVAELQARGAIHYHMVVWLPKGVYLPKIDTQGWWTHGSTNIVTAESPIGYITKYASKTTAEGVAGYPKGARICGHGGLTPDGRRHVRYWQAPMWVRDGLTGRADIRKVVGGYVDRLSGEFLPSPWRVFVAPGGDVYAYRIDLTEGTIQ